MSVVIFQSIFPQKQLKSEETNAFIKWLKQKISTILVIKSDPWIFHVWIHKVFVSPDRKFSVRIRSIIMKWDYLIEEWFL